MLVDVVALLAIACGLLLLMMDVTGLIERLPGPGALPAELAQLAQLPGPGR